VRPHRYRPPWGRIIFEAAVAIVVYIASILIGRELFPDQAIIVALVLMVITLFVLRTTRPKPE
jgi:hypothetical protein